MTDPGPDPAHSAPLSPRRRRARRVVLLTLTTALVGYAAIMLVYLNARRPAQLDTGDFRHFYDAAAAMTQGRDIYASGTGGYIYPPLIAFLYQPLAHLSHAAAAHIASVLNLACVMLAGLLLARHAVRVLFRRNDLVLALASMLLGLVLIADKIKAELQMWQTNALVMLMIVLSARALDRAPLIAGLALGLAFNIKYLTIAFLPWLLLRRRFRAAAGFVLGIVLFALLPALSTGWHGNLADLRTAFAGVLKLLGLATGPAPAANIEVLAIGFSVSIPSAMARFLHGSHAAALAASALIAAACAALALVMYRRRRCPALMWPARQDDEPYRTLLLLELGAITTAVLVFSPQTNPRHLSLLFIPAIIAAAMLFRALATHRPAAFRTPPSATIAGWPLLLGMLVLVAGLVLPPGGDANRHHVNLWHQRGGPSWTTLIFLYTLIHTATTIATLRQRPATPQTRDPVTP